MVEVVVEEGSPACPAGVTDRTTVKEGATDFPAGAEAVIDRTTEEELACLAKDRTTVEEGATTCPAGAIAPISTSRKASRRSMPSWRRFSAYSKSAKAASAAAGLAPRPLRKVTARSW